MGIDRKFKISLINDILKSAGKVGFYTSWGSSFYQRDKNVQNKIVDMKTEWENGVIHESKGNLK